MSFIMVEYLCSAHDPPFRFDSLEYRPPPPVSSCPHCGGEGELVISGPRVFGQFVTVERGKVAPPPSPHALDTSAYGRREVGYREWRANRTKQLRDIRIKEVRDKVK